MKKKLVVLTLLASMSMTSYADIQTVQNALEQDDLLLAQQVFNTLTTEEKNAIPGQVLKGRLLLENDETEDAFDHFEALQKQHASNVDINYYLGVSAVIMAQKASIFSKLGYAEDFLEAMEKTIELKPDHTEALNTLIGFHLAAPGIAGGDTEKALIYANQLKETDPEQGFMQLSIVYRKTDKTELAVKTLQAGLEKFPESSSLYFTRATALMNKKAWSKARADLNLAIKYAENDGDKSSALYQQGKASAESGEEIELGIHALTQAMPLADKEYKPWIEYRLAQLYIHSNNFKKTKDAIAMIDTNEDDDLKSKVKKLKKKLKKLMS